MTRRAKSNSSELVDLERAREIYRELRNEFANGSIGKRSARFRDANLIAQLLDGGEEAPRALLAMTLKQIHNIPQDRATARTRDAIKQLLDDKRVIPGEQGRQFIKLNPETRA